MFALPQMLLLTSNLCAFRQAECTCICSGNYGLPYVAIYFEAILFRTVK